jgi:hypothetical protein
MTATSNPETTTRTDPVTRAVPSTVPAPAAPGAQRSPRMRQHLATDEQGRLLIDVRGPRVSAAITTLVLALALVVQGSVGLALVVWQWAVFAIATFAGLAWSPYGNVFRLLKRRLDLGPPPATELEGPPRFAQACGFAVLTVGLAAFALGASPVGWIAVGVVLALSTLLAATGLCIGCELYLLGQRLAGRRIASGTAGTGDA